MLDMYTPVLLKRPLFDSNTALCKIVGRNSLTNTYVLSDGYDESIIVSRSDFLLHFPHPGQKVRVLDTEHNIFPLDSIVEIKDIIFNDLSSRHKYLYKCYGPYREDCEFICQYLFREDLTLFR